jgi:hypothetical protein
VAILAPDSVSCRVIDIYHEELAFVSNKVVCSWNVCIIWVRRLLGLSPSVCVCVCLSLSLSLSIYIYIYIYRVCSKSVYIYIYIYIFALARVCMCVYGVRASVDD